MKKIFAVLILFMVFACQNKTTSRSEQNKKELSQYLDQKITETDKLIQQHPDSAKLQLMREFLVQRKNEIKNDR